MDPMHELSSTRGYFLRREAIELGYEDRQLYAQLRRGVIVRIRHGAYCHTEIWTALREEDRHLARAHASQDLSVGTTALSHISALAAFGAPLWNVALDESHLTRCDEGSSRREAGVVHHTGTIGPTDLVRRDGRLITSGTRTTVDGLTLMSVEAGMVAGDWMLNQDLTSIERCWALKSATNHWPDTRVLEVTLRLLDGNSQSAGESRARYLFWRMHLPKPLLQHRVYGPDGELIAITDFAWPDYGIYGEFDGRVKYGRTLHPTGDLELVLFGEKQREDAVRRATGGTMIRWTWRDLAPNSAPSLQLLGLLKRTA